MKGLTTLQRRVLSAVPANPTSAAEIAEELGEMTHWIRSTLKALEHKGFIACTKKGGLGLPSWWKITPAGRALLQSQEGR